MMTALLRLYPGWWRRRYAAEVGEVLALAGTGRADRFDLLRGALDAWLHPPTQSLVAPLAAVSGGAAWTAMALVEAQDPPTDWPGYALDVLPLATMGTAAAAVAAVSLWLRLGDRTGRMDTGVLWLVVAGHVAWFAGLLAMGLGAGVGPAVGLASAVAAVSVGLLGLLLVTRGDWLVGLLLALAPGALVVAVPAAWLLFGVAWSLAGLAAWPRSSPGPRGLA